ncbi:MAG: hypothetical protein WCI84_01825 [Bacteroidota bacterium]
MRCNYYYSAALSLLLLSCNLFDTRDPENPVADNQTLQPATSASMLISNFTTAFQQKNLQEYQKLFADSTFRFIPTQSASARYSAVFLSWNKTSESDYFRNAITEIGNASTPQLSFTTVSNIQFQSDSVAYTMDYIVYIPHSRTTAKQCTGRSELYMAPNKNNIWSIYRWVDFETKKDSSWSELKGQFSK